MCIELSNIIADVVENIESSMRSSRYTILFPAVFMSTLVIVLLFNKHATGWCSMGQ